ncbi:sulfite exporter TauE/SafE family protein [Gallaecimonas sp. GXIMD4217]|uniref:sulfite exporter TauE/SafE family protein n=1 Tax=Gallaecimonas sp. GXIMD4217 TaxID=3131927 RepID=UPI00311AFBCD
MTLTFAGALLIGLAGAGHCFGMCGSMMGAFSLTLPEDRRLGALLLYNLGRVSSYALAGALVGASGAYVAAVGAPVFLVLKLVAALLLILMGLYLGQWYFGLVRLEKLGQLLWQRLQPISKRLLPLKSAWLALPLGMLWGWLPCGLVYSTLAWAALAGSAQEGALVMAAFGLGTLPAMLGTGLAAQKLKKLLKHKGFRRISALLLFALAGQLLYGLWHQWS